VSEISTKPYLIRAIYEWCVDGGQTPYLAVKVDEYTQVPMAYVKDGKIVLNISVEAVRNLHIGNDAISCSGRFGGVPHQIMVPIESVMGIFSKESGQGLVFQETEAVSKLTIIENSSGDDTRPPESPGPSGKPKLRVVK
jgi:stringent starvation protein B